MFRYYSYRHYSSFYAHKKKCEIQQKKKEKKEDGCKSGRIRTDLITKPDKQEKYSSIPNNLARCSVCNKNLKNRHALLVS